MLFVLITLMEPQQLEHLYMLIIRNLIQRIRIILFL
jgi:hypothetical protein